MLAILFVVLWVLPGAYLARGMYSEQIRRIRSHPGELVPPKPPKPKIRLEEMLHYVAPKKCGLLRNPPSYACDCKYRGEWIRLRNAWEAYNEWERKYGRIANPLTHEPKPAMLAVYAAVPLWPLFLLHMFITGGAKKIPDYRQIERIEKELGIGNDVNDILEIEE